MRTRQLLVIATLFATVVCSSGSPAASAPPATLAATPPATTTAAASASVNGCTSPTFDYIERDVDPEAQTLAQEIGNCDLATGQDSLATFQQTAGRSPHQPAALQNDRQIYAVDRGLDQGGTCAGRAALPGPTRRGTAGYATSA